jgi:hypothetical protein
VARSARGSAFDVEAGLKAVQNAGQSPRPVPEQGEHGWAEVMRIRNASIRTPTPRPKAMVLRVLSGVLTKLAKTENMISAAAVTMREALRAP